MNDGFVKIPRALFDHPFFNTPRKFTKFEALIDLVQMASYSDGNEQWVGGKRMVINKGEVAASYRYLETRWGWSKKKISTFLRDTKRDTLIDLEKRQGQTVITICIPGVYDGPEKPKETPKKRRKETPKETESSTAKRHRRERKGDKDKEGQEIFTIPKGIVIDQKKSPQKKERKPPQKTENQLMYDEYLIVFQKIWGDENPQLDPKDWRAFKLILKKIKRRIVSRSPDLVDIKQVEFKDALENYRLFLEAVYSLQDRWHFENFTPCNLNSQFQNLILKIKNRRNGKTNGHHHNGQLTNGVSPEVAQQVLNELMEDDRRRKAAGL